MRVYSTVSYCHDTVSSHNDAVTRVMHDDTVSHITAHYRSC